MPTHLHLAQAFHCEASMSSGAYVVGLLEKRWHKRTLAPVGYYPKLFSWENMPSFTGYLSQRLVNSTSERNLSIIAKTRTQADSMTIHLIDGTYELYRHFYGQRSFNEGKDKPFGAVVGVLNGVLQMIEEGATHVGVATDHVIESFRNELWTEYKTGEGIERALRKQFHPLEEALVSMGIVVWPMIELEADDALASAAHLAAGDPRVEKVCIWTPDKDLAQCVQEDRVVQIDRRAGAIRDAAAVRKKFGVDPLLIPDFLALVGDSADGYPGISGIGKIGAAKLLNAYGPIEDFPKNVLVGQRKQALLFKRLATLRTDAGLFSDADELRWRGPTSAFAKLTAKLGNPHLLDRANAAAAKASGLPD